VALGEADVFEVVVFPPGPHAFLRGSSPVVLPLLQTQKHILELVHPRIREQQGRIAMGHQRRTPHPPMAFAFKELQKLLAYLIPSHHRPKLSSPNSIPAIAHRKS